MHGSKFIKPGTLRAILRGVQIDAEELKRLLQSDSLCLAVPSPVRGRPSGHRSADPSGSAVALSSPRFPARAGKQMEKAGPAGTLQARLRTCPVRPPPSRGKGTAALSSIEARNNGGREMNAGFMAFSS